MDLNDHAKPSVMMAWELGGGMGHAGRLAALTRGLHSHARVTLALRDLTQAQLLPSEATVVLHQAPLWLPEARGLPEAASYAELLFRSGFLDAKRLLPVARAWRTLYASAAPDLLLVDHAPTALLAARGLPMRRALIGTGFFSPPPQRPMPPFRIWENLPAGRIEKAEALALATANEVLHALGAPLLTQLSDLLAADENFLTTWPELDHYAPRAEGTAYWGPEALMDAGTPAEWPEGEQARAFVYLKASDARTVEVLQALADSPVCTLAVVDGLPAALRERLEGPHLRISSSAVRMDQVCAQADVVICNANSGTVSAMLLAGKPVILLPSHAEQHLFGLRVQATGAGVVLESTSVRTQLPKLLAIMTQEGPHRRAAKRLSERHAGADIAGTLDRVVQRCRELLR